MHEADDAYSIWSTWSCYWLDQFLTLALDAWILSKFSTLYWICLLLVFLVLVGVEHSILECYNLFSGVELSMRSFFVISILEAPYQEMLSLLSKDKIENDTLKVVGSLQKLDNELLKLLRLRVNQVIKKPHGCFPNELLKLLCI